MESPETVAEPRMGPSLWNAHMILGLDTSAKHVDAARLKQAIKYLLARFA
jgi:hypothetical protein